MKRLILTTLPIGLALFGATVGDLPSARADLFMLASGGQVEGELLNRAESPRQNYIVKLAEGGQLTLDKKMVANVVVRSDAERRYEELLPKMPQTVEGHWKMAEWCKERGLDSLRENHLREVIKLDPEHEPARFALGYNRVRGKWKTVEEFFREQGYVKHGSSWKLPQEIAILTAIEQAKKQEIEWRQKIKILRQKLDRKGGERAFEELRAIRDPAAAAPLAAIVDDKNESRDLKLAVIDILGRLDSGVAIGSLVKHSVHDEDVGIRERCLDQLERIKNQSITTAYCRMLRDENNVTIRRAAIALARFKDPAATFPLIDALVTKHKQVITTGGGPGSISPTFSQDGGGGGGLTAGGGPKVVQREVNNETVLAALTALYPGINFGYDEAAWRRWYGEAKMPKANDLRRDP